MSLYTDQHVMQHLTNGKFAKSSPKIFRAARSAPRAMARGPEPDMKILGTTGQQLRPVNDQVIASTSQTSSQSSIAPYPPVQPSIPRSYNVSLFGEFLVGASYTISKL